MEIRDEFHDVLTCVIVSVIIGEINPIYLDIEILLQFEFIINLEQTQCPCQHISLAAMREYLVLFDAVSFWIFMFWHPHNNIQMGVELSPFY